MSQRSEGSQYSHPVRLARQAAGLCLSTRQTQRAIVITFGPLLLRLLFPIHLRNAHETAARSQQLEGYRIGQYTVVTAYARDL